MHIGCGPHPGPEKTMARQSQVTAGPSLSSARARGLEPPTTGSTVRYSNQLSYAPEVFLIMFLSLLK